MNKYILILGIAAVTASCSKLSDPISEISESYYLSSSGQNQKAFGGEYLQDSIFVTVYDQLNYRHIAGLDVEFEVVSGGGSIETQYTKTDSRGMAGARWKLGSQTGTQVVRVRVGKADGSVFLTLSFSASCFLPDTWNATTAYPDIGFSDMAADTVSGTTLAVSNSTMYIQGDRFYEWEQLGSVTFSQPRRILFGNDRNFYAGTWDGRLYKSANLGLSWSECAKPWDNNSYFYYMGITSDNTLWATANGRGLRCSRDGGQSWTTDTIGIDSGEMLSDICRLSDGTLFFFTLSCHLYKSTDGGHQWTSVPVPGYPLKLFVNENDELILFSQVNGITVYKSTDKGENFVSVKSVPVSFYTMMDHTVHRRGGIYYLLIPGYGILKTSDFNTYTSFWQHNTARDMLMDATGNFLVTELQSGTVNYFGVGPK